MKKLLICIVFLSLFSFRGNTQTEIKANPLALMFYGIGLGVEQGFSDEFGVDLSTLIVDEGALFWLAGKYYLSPRQGLDRFHVGLFVGATTETSAGVGFMIGTKSVSRSNKILFDIGIGAGRTFDGGFLPYGRLALGYRFGRK